MSHKLSFLAPLAAARQKSRVIRPRNSLTLLGLGAISAMALSIPAPAFGTALAGGNDAFYNEDVTTPPAPNNTQTSITIELAGDQTANLDNFWYNSFYNNTDTAPSISVIGGNTYLTYGPGDFSNTGGGHFGYGIKGGTPEPHGTGSPDVINKSWGTSTPNSQSGYNQPATTVTLNTTTPSTGPYKYILVYTDATLNSSLGTVNTRAKDWEEIAVAASDPPSIDIGNYESDSLTLNSVDYFVSDNQIPLDQLNNTDLPLSDPRWQLIPGITDGAMIASGGQLQSSPIPEPATLGLLSLGGLGLLLKRKRKAIA